MIVVTCLPCAFVIRVMPAQITETSSTQELRQLVGDLSSFWPDQYPCPRCGKMVRGIWESEADPRALQLMALQEATPQEAFAAFSGLGFPDEQHCSLATVLALLLEHPVRRLVGSDIAGAERAVVDSIELWDGTRLHFGASSYGAVVYRITRPISYTRKAEEASCLSK